MLIHALGVYIIEEIGYAKFAKNKAKLSLLSLALLAGVAKAVYSSILNPARKNLCLLGQFLECDLYYGR